MQPTFCEQVNLKKILSEFNTHDRKLTFEEKLQKGIKVPLIYPELSKYFPKNLIKVQQDPQFSNYNFSNPNTLILLKTKIWKTGISLLSKWNISND